MARLPIPPINPNNPIPNNPFFYPTQNYIQGEYSPFIVGSGLSLDNVTGVISASGVASSLAAGPGISLTTVGTTTTIGNLGLVGLTATSPINVTAGTTPDISVDAASTTQPGVVQLANTTTSSSVSQALTAAAGYSLQQQIDALVVSNNLTLAGTINGSTGDLATVTTEGGSAGFNLFSPLPTPSTANKEYFVIVTTPGTMTPPGGVATAVNQGDWWVSDGTSWIYYPVGFDPTYATTTNPGVVQLATNAEVQAGTESTHAVTSSALQSKLSDSVNLASSTCIASSNAVRTANNTALAAQSDATSALSQVALAQADATQALSDAATAQFTANAAIPCACYTAKGDILGGTGAGTFSVLSPGTDGYMLYALSSATNGLQWAAPPADIPCAVITAVGDIVVGSGPSTPTALPVGANGYILAANSACATGLEWVANAEGDVTSVTGTLPITVNNINPQTPIVGINVATSGTTGVVSIGSNINVTGAGAISVNTASTTQSGVVQLNDTTASTSTTLALTAAQGKNLQDQINALSITSNITLAGTLDTVTGNLVTVTAAGALASFVVGSPLPAAAAGNAEYFVIVTVAAASYTPPGGTATQTHVGDWFLSSGTAWDFLDVGFDPPYASTTDPGVVQLATSAQTQTGTDATLAVTPAGACATYVPLSAYTAKGTLLAASAANTPIALAAPFFNGQLLYSCSACPSGLVWGPKPTPSNATPGAAGVVQGCTTFNFPAGGITSLGDNTMGDNITTGGSNVAIGDNAGYWMSSGCNNTAVGSGALFSATAATENNNTAIGCGSGSNAGGSGNTLLGVYSGYQVGDNNLGGDNNTLLGFKAGCDITSGTNNVAVGCGVTVASATGSCQLAIGYALGQYWLTGTSTKAIKPGAGIIDCAGSCGTNGQVLMSNGANAVCWGTASGASAATPTSAGVVLGCTVALNTGVGCNALLGNTSTGNTAVGVNALDASPSGDNNTAVGACALTANTSGVNNTAFGSLSLSATTTGGFNVGVGRDSLLANTTGSCNIAIGYRAACGLTTGDFNVAIGPSVQVASATGSCQLAIGFSLTDNWLTGTSTKAIRPGAGIIDCTGSCGTAGQALLSDGANAVCWGSVSAAAATPTTLGTLFGCTKSTGTCAVAVGYQALNANPTGNWNVAVGPGAGSVLSTGQWNTFVGACAGQGTTTGTAMVAMGINAGFASNGSSSVFIGNSAGARAGVSNVAIGASALALSTTGSCCNVIIGTNAVTCVNQNNSVVLGYQASQAAGGNFNTVIGSLALQGSSNTTAPCNSTLGYKTLNAATTANLNVALGYAAGCLITSGAQNVLIGPNVGSTCTTESCTLAIGYSNTALWLTGDSTKAIKPGAGIIDCAGSCGTAGQILTSNGSNAIQWATSTAPQEYTANKALTSGTPVNLLSWTGGVRAGDLTIFATDNSTIVKWANITVGSVTGIGSTAVITQSVGMGNFTITAGGGGETIVTFTPSATFASVDFLYQYNAAFGAQPSVL